LNSVTTERFRRAQGALPVDVQRRARRAYAIFRQDPDHPGLRFKPVHATRPIYSARIGLGYRALAVRDGETWVWFWIGNHGDYDRLLRNL